MAEVRKTKIKITFLNHRNNSAGGFASARHFNVTLSLSGRIIKRLGIGSSFAKCTETLGASENSKTKRKPFAMINKKKFNSVTS